MVVWMSPSDCFPPHGLDMTRGSRDHRKVMWLYDQFVENGFDEDEPALVGYPLDGKVQLLSGTHRHRAAGMAGIKLPVTLWLRSDIEEVWGTDAWKEIMRDIPVRELC